LIAGEPLLSHHTDTDGRAWHHPFLLIHVPHASNQIQRRSAEGMPPGPPTHRVRKVRKVCRDLPQPPRTFHGHGFHIISAINKYDAAAHAGRNRRRGHIDSVLLFYGVTVHAARYLFRVPSGAKRGGPPLFGCVSVAD
jgi:hypothetical protein